MHNSNPRQLTNTLQLTNSHFLTQPPGLQAVQNPAKQPGYGSSCCSKAREPPPPTVVGQPFIALLSKPSKVWSECDSNGVSRPTTPNNNADKATASGHKPAPHDKRPLVSFSRQSRQQNTRLTPPDPQLAHPVMSVVALRVCVSHSPAAGRSSTAR